MHQRLPRARASVASVLLAWSLTPILGAQEGKEGSSPAVMGGSATASVGKGQAKAIELCQACHQFEGAEQAGTVGPPFVAMKERFPDRAKLQAILYDAQVASKPHTMMPPFGRNGLISKQEIEQIIDFLYTL